MLDDLDECLSGDVDELDDYDELIHHIIEIEDEDDEIDFIDETDDVMVEQVVLHINHVVNDEIDDTHGDEHID